MDRFLSIKAKVVGLSVVAIAALIAMMLWEPNPEGTKPTGEPLVIYCAAGIKPPVLAAARAYEKKYGVPVQLQYGGSGTLLSNLRVAKTGDLYVAGDSSFIDIAREQNLLDEAIPLAHQRPVIAVVKGNPKKIKSADDLLTGVRVGLGNPDAASVGKQTRKLLIASGQWDALEKAVRERGVFKPTVNDIAADIKIGTIDAGVIWDSTANQYPEIEIVAPLTDDESFRLQVTIGVLKSTKQPAAALRFARYLAARDRGLREFGRYGYKPVKGDKWAKTPEIMLFSGGVNRVAIEDTINAFERREGVRITRVYNGCGILVSQMKTDGKRPDAYLSCDVSFMTQVSDLFWDSVDISETDMLIAVQKGNPSKISSLKSLTADGLKLGVANAKQSALGALTERMLDEADLLEGVMKNVISQTPTADLLVNQLRTDTLDAVIVYEANVAQVREHVDVVRIDLPSAKAIQPFAVGKNSEYPHLVGRLLDAIRSADSRRRYQNTGFRWLAQSKEP